MKKHGAVIRIVYLVCLVSGVVRGEIKHVCFQRSMAREAPRQLNYSQTSTEESSVLKTHEP